MPETGQEIGAAFAEPARNFSRRMVGMTPGLAIVKRQAPIAG